MKKIVNGKEELLSSSEMAEFDQKEIDHKIEVLERAKQLYKELRKAEYPSTEDLVVALWEKVAENNPTPFDDLQSKRVAIKAKYPNPTK